MITYKDLYTQVIKEIEKRKTYPSTEDWNKQLSTTRVLSPVLASGFDVADITNAMFDLLEDIVPSRIKSGLTVIETTPISNKIIIKAGVGTVGGRIYRLIKDVTIQVPFDDSTYIFYINLYQDEVKIERSSISSQLTIAKINIPKPGVTNLVQDKRDESWNAYIVNLKEYKLYGDADGNFEEDTIDLLRDNISPILADNIIGNIKLSEHLTITNLAGTLELDSVEQRWKDSDGNILAKFNRRGTFFYDTSGREMARFTADDAKIGSMIIIKDAIHSENYVSGNSGFKIKADGTVEFRGGTIGGTTITPTKLYGGIIQTGANVGIGQTGVIMDSDGLRGYDAVLGNTFNLPTDGSRPTFSSGTINETIFEISTSAVLRTSTTVGDGSADSAGILINNTGLYACETNQLLANANLKALIDGSVTLKAGIVAETGDIGGVTITSIKLVGGLIEGTTIRSGIFETAETAPRIRIDEVGVYFQETTQVGKYGGTGSGMLGFKYGDGTKYGSGLMGMLFNHNYPPLSILRECSLADIRLFNRTSDPGSGTGPHKLGDLICVDGIIKRCSVAGSPGTFEALGGDVASIWDDDEDTGIQTEESADEDKIRFDTAGIQRALLDSNGLILSSGADITEFSTDGTLGDNSDDAVPTEKATKTYVDGQTDKIGEGHINIEFWAYSAIGQGTYVWSGNTFYYKGGVFYNSSAADGDNFSCKVYLAAGTYTLLIVTCTHSSRGILDVDVDDVEVASFDGYGATVRNARKEQAGITISTSGVKTLKMRIDGKNASSSGYSFTFQAIVFYRTA